MAKYLILFVIVFGLFGCQNNKKKVVQMQAVQDSLMTESITKDSAILGFLTDLNEIQQNLDSIKKMEKLISVDQKTGVEMTLSKKRRIVHDIGMLKDLLEQNKTLIASLKQKLNNSNYKIGKLEQTIVEFNKMVTTLTQRIDEKDADIKKLNDKVKKLYSNIQTLNRQIEDVSEESNQKSQVIESQISQLNTAFYAYGTAKELLSNDVAEKSGGILRISKNLIIKKDFNRYYFTKVDIRKFKELPLNAKKARILTVHPEASYRLSGEKTADTLYIQNSEEFWKASKYLLIVID